MTAASSTAPVMSSRADESSASKVKPEPSDVMMTMPSSADHAEPRPPKRLVPPMTAAAIAVR